MRFLSTRALGMGCAVLSLAGLSLLGTAPAARAAEVTFNLTPNVVNQTTDFTTMFTTSRFDPSLGTLTGIRFDFNTSITSNIHITNTSASTSTGFVNTSVFVNLQDPNALFPAAPGQSGINQFSATSANYNYSIAPNSSADSGNLTGSSMQTGNINNGTTNAAGIFAEFTGTSPIVITGGTQTFTSNNFTGGNTTTSQVTQASLSGTITYIYTPAATTPEPGTLPLIATGLMTSGLVVIRRKRKSGK